MPKVPLWMVRNVLSPWRHMTPMLSLRLCSESRTSELWTSAHRRKLTWNTVVFATGWHMTMPQALWWYHCCKQQNTMPKASMLVSVSWFFIFLINWVLTESCLGCKMATQNGVFTLYCKHTFNFCIWTGPWLLQKLCLCFTERPEICSTNANRTWCPFGPFSPWDFGPCPGFVSVP